MTPQPAASTPLPLDPAITDATLATIFGAGQPDRDDTLAPPDPQLDTGAALIAVLRPRDPLEAAYATRAAAAHIGSVECIRRAMLPDVPDNAAIRWAGKGLALSRMNVDMVRMVKECQAAPPGAQPKPAGRSASTAELDDVLRGAAATLAAVRAGRRDPMSSERPAVSAGAAASAPAPEAAPAAAAPAAKPAGGQAPMSGERPASAPTASAARAQLAAALAGKPVGTRDPMSSERPSFVPSDCVLTTQAGAASFLSAPPPRQSLRAALLGSTTDVGAMLATAGATAKPHVK